MSDELLTDDEHAALQLLGGLAELLAEIIAAGDDEVVGFSDFGEAAHHVHVLQRMVGAQAAARAYPDRYRLLGSSTPRSDTVSS